MESNLTIRTRERCHRNRTPLLQCRSKKSECRSKSGSSFCILTSDFCILLLPESQQAPTSSSGRAAPACDTLSANEIDLWYKVQAARPPLLNAGTKLGPYEITAPLGAGGMGEVYRARDSRLKREVAIKVLPHAFALDADRLHRF